VRRFAVVALALLAACSASPNARPKVKAHATTTSTPTTASSTTSTTGQATTTTIAGALAKPCAASDLGVGGIDADGASQHRLTYVRLLNTSAFTCSLSGFPTSMTAVDQDGHPLEHVDQGAYQPDPPAGDVAPGASGLLIIDTKTACDEATKPATRMFRKFDIGIPGGGTLSLGDFAVDGSCGVAVSKLGVQK
jgi:hypothetical protein